MHHRIYITLQTVDVCISKLGSTESYLYMYMQFYYELTMVFTVKDSYFMCRYTIYYLYTHIYIYRCTEYIPIAYICSRLLYMCANAAQHDVTRTLTPNIHRTYWVHSGVLIAGLRWNVGLLNIMNFTHTLYTEHYIRNNNIHNE